MHHEVRLGNHPENELLVQGSRKIRVRLKIKPSAACFSASDISFLPNPSPFIIRIRFLYLRTVLDVGEFPR